MLFVVVKKLDKLKNGEVGSGRTTGKGKKQRESQKTN